MSDPSLCLRLVSNYVHVLGKANHGRNRAPGLRIGHGPVVRHLETRIWLYLKSVTSPIMKSFASFEKS